MEKNKKIEIYKNLILDVPGVDTVKFDKSVESSVTTSWGVNWDADFIARDILQNFRDSNLSEIEKVVVNTKNDKIIVEGKNCFDLRKLFFVGSNKAGDDTTVGEYGEGFKAAVVSMLKRGIQAPVSVSNDTAIVIDVGDEVVEDLRPLVYHFFKVNKQNKTTFMIHTYDKELKAAFDFGMAHFWFEKNPLVGEELHSYNDIACYKSKNPKEGYLFYRGVMRGKISHIPLVINIPKKYAQIENKIKSDRDRNSFDNKLVNSFLSIWARSGFHYHGMENNPAIRYVLETSKKIWDKGHPLLAALANNAWNIKDDKSLIKLFGSKYFADSAHYHSRGITWSEWYDKKTQTYIIKKDRELEKKGKIKLPSYFVRFGVISSLEMFVKNKESLEKRIRTKKTAPLNPKQKKAVNYAMECISKVAPNFSSLYNTFKEDQGIYELDFKTIESKDLLGELKDSRDYDGKTIYLNKDLFKSNFGKFFAIMTHEMGHVFGKDGEREFSDVLTHIIAQAVDKNSVISKYSRNWTRYRV